MRRDRTGRIGASALAAVLASACTASHRPPASPATPPTSAAAPTSPAERQALLDVCRAARVNGQPRTDPHEDLDAILYQQTAAEYRANATTVYRGAAAALAGLAKDARKARPRRDPVVVFDLDETVLDNSAFQARLLVEKRKYDGKLWDCWVGLKQAGLVPGADLLFRAMAKEGVRGRFITNRKCEKRAAETGVCPQKSETLGNLNALLDGTGYAASEAELLLAGDTEPGTGTKWAGEKQPRRDFVARSHAIVMLVGDDLGDFMEGVREATIDERAARMAGVRDRWGTAWFVLPNPSYGSWVGALDRAAPDAHDTLVRPFAYPQD